MTPQVSVVLPTRNRARSIGRSIESVLDQTFTDFELIIVDDHSTDATDDVMTRYLGDHRVRFVSSVRHGCAAARNVGVMLARGRYVAFQDSDDEWLPRKLEKAVDALTQAGPQVGVLYTDMLAVDTEGRLGGFGAPDVERGVLINERKLDYQVCGIGIQSAVIRRECFDVVGLFDEELRRWIDLDLFIRLSDRYDFIRSREALVVYSHSSPADCISNDRPALVEARIRMLAKYEYRLRPHPRQFAMQYFHIAMAAGRSGRWMQAARFLAMALATSPLPPIRAALRECGLQARRAIGATRGLAQFGSDAGTHQEEPRRRTP